MLLLLAINLNMLQGLKGARGHRDTQRWKALTSVLASE